MEHELALGFALVVVIVGIPVLFFIWTRAHNRAMTPEQRAMNAKAWEESYQTSRWGSLNSPLVCPHCQERGHVRTMKVELKKGISGAKATGGLLTGGLSILATGLSRKESATQAYCCHCDSTWHY